MVGEPFLGLAPHVIKQMSCGFETLQAEGMAISVHRTERTPRALHGQPRLHPGERSNCDSTDHREPRGTAHFSGCMKPSTSASPAAETAAISQVRGLAHAVSPWLLRCLSPRALR